VRNVVLRTVATGLASVLALACGSEPAPLEHPLRLVDESLREGSTHHPATAVTRILEGAASNRGSTSDLPTATIGSDTRFVLQTFPPTVLAHLRPTRFSADGRASVVFDVGGHFPSAQRVVLSPYVRTQIGGTRLPAVWARIAQGNTREVTLELELPPPGRPTDVNLSVIAYHAPDGTTTSYRTRRLRVPSRTALDFSIGVLEEAADQAPVRFSVSHCEASDCSVLFDEVLDPASRAGPGWHDRRVSLAHLSGQTRALAFETELLGGRGDRFSMPVWGNPTLRPESAPRDRDRRNLILVSIDTLRRDHLGAYGYHRDTSPFLDRHLAAKGTVFENVIAEAATTEASHMTMFTSLPALVHGVQGTRSAEVPLLTLAAVLRSAGFETAAFTENGPLAHHRGFALGFDVYHENKRRSRVAPLLPTGEAAETFRRGREWMERNGDRPFFLFLHTFQVHAPYAPPAPYADLFLDSNSRPLPHLAEGSRLWNEREALVANYDREIRYVDRELERLVRWLETSGLAERTILVVLSDHGEGFYEHGARGHAILPYESVLRVPLILHGPGIPRGRRIRAPIHHLDLMPTVLDLLGVRAPSPLEGRSVTSLLDEEPAGGSEDARPIFSAVWSLPPGLPPPALAVRRGSRKLIRYEDADGTRLLYFDLDRDPLELTDLSREREREAAELEGLLDRYVNEAGRLREWLRAEDGGELRPPDPVPDPEREEKLRALGYLAE
jgi:arylsulfatase A-like enzyme